MASSAHCRCAVGAVAPRPAQLAAVASRPAHTAGSSGAEASTADETVDEPAAAVEGDSATDPPARGSPGDPGVTDCCYIVGEATSDWRRVFQKLLQLERDLWVLLLRIKLKGVDSPVIKPNWVQNTWFGHEVEQWVGLAYLVVLDSNTAAATNRVDAKAALRAIIQHHSFEQVFPLCAHLSSLNRLGVLYASNEAEQLLVGAILQGVANTHAIAALDTKVAALGMSVMGNTHAIAALDTRVAALEMSVAANTRAITEMDNKVNVILSVVQGLPVLEASAVAAAGRPLVHVCAAVAT